VPAHAIGVRMPIQRSCLHKFSCQTGVRSKMPSHVALWCPVRISGVLELRFPFTRHTNISIYNQVDTLLSDDEGVCIRGLAPMQGLH